MGVTSEKIIGEFATNLRELHKTTAFMRINAIKKKLEALRGRMREEVIPIGVGSFRITYDATSMMERPEFYLELRLHEAETITLDLFLLTDLQRKFQHYFEFTHLLITRESVAMVFELSR